MSTTPDSLPALSETRLSEIDARANAARPGPWRWFGNMRHRGVYLATERGGRVFVMQFDRWGMGNAQPVFQVNQVMRRLPEMADMIECDHNGEIIRLAHPDAEFIAGSRQDVDDLLAEVRRLQGELAAAHEETAQSVREEREACADLASSLIGTKCSCDGAGEVDPNCRGLMYNTACEDIIAAIRSRSLPGETADA